MAELTAKNHEPQGSLFLITVLPITKSPVRDSLTYFSSTSYVAGDIILVPLRGKNIQGFVIECTPAVGQKMGLKRSDFQLRKIEPQEPKRLLSSAIIRTAESLARSYATTTGMILRSLITDTALAIRHTTLETVRTTGIRKEKLVLEAPYTERRDMYARLVRQVFASKQSVYIVCPSTEEVEQVAAVVERGIEHRTFAITPELSKATYQAKWLAATRQTEPVVIIGTYAIVSIPRRDIGLIVLERESARAYALPTKPYVHVRDVAIVLSEELRAELLLGDDLLTIDTQYAIEQGEYQRCEDRERRDSISARMRVIDIQKLEKVDKITPSLTRPLLEAIDTTIAEGGRVFVYTARKGFGTVLMCGDCGETVICPHCNNNMKVVEKKKQRVLTCPFCRHHSSALVACSNCKSWKLITLGITTEQVKADLRKTRPDIPVHILDSEYAKSHTHAKRIRDAWKVSGGILIGTEMAIPYARGLAELVCISSLDALYSLPDWKAHERASHHVYMFAQSTPKLAIQSRHTKHDVVEQIRGGDMAKVISMELALRKKFNYPPYRALVSIKMQGTPERVRREMATVKRLVGLWIVDEQVTPKPRGTQLATLILNTVQPFPDELYVALRSLPPYIAVSTHPESTL